MGRAFVRYFFDLQDGLEFHGDGEGIEFSDDVEARLHALHYLGEAALAIVRGKRDQRSLSIKVRSANGDPVFEVSLELEIWHRAY